MRPTDRLVAEVVAGSVRVNTLQTDFRKVHVSGLRLPSDLAPSRVLYIVVAPPELSLPGACLAQPQNPGSGHTMLL